MHDRETEGARQRAFFAATVYYLVMGWAALGPPYTPTNILYYYEVFMRASECTGFDLYTLLLSSKQWFLARARLGDRILAREKSTHP